MKIRRNKTVTVTLSPPKELLPLVEARRKALNLSRTAYWVRLAMLDLGLSRDFLPAITAKVPAERDAPAFLNEERRPYGKAKSKSHD